MSKGTPDPSFSPPCPCPYAICLKGAAGVTGPELPEIERDLDLCNRMRGVLSKSTSIPIPISEAISISISISGRGGGESRSGNREARKALTSVSEEETEEEEEWIEEWSSGMVELYGEGLDRSRKRVSSRAVT